MPDMKVMLDALRTTRKSVNETIVLDIARDDEGNDFHVIRDILAPSGQRVLYREPQDIARASGKVAEGRLEELRDRRVIQAVLAAAGVAYPGAERAEG